MIGEMKEGESWEEYNERRRETYEMLEAQHRQSPLSCNCNCDCDCGSKSDPIPSLVPLISWGVEKIRDWRNRKNSTPPISDTIELPPPISDTIEPPN